MNWGPNVIATLLTFVLAAYLGKEKYGLVGIALLYISFARIFLEGGLGAAIVQRKDLDPEHLDAVFWITLTFSFALTLLTWAASPFLAEFYQLPELQRVLNYEAFILPLQGLTVVQESLLEKKLDFKSLAIRSNVSTLIGGLVGLAVAVTGFGVWALVWEDLVAAVVRVVLLWRLGTWRPRMRFSLPHIKELAGFSLYVMIAQIGTFVQRRSDAMLVGAFFGAAAVGIYQMADRLINLVIEMMTRPVILVVLPHFSRMQDNLVELRKSVINCLKTSAMLTIPLLAILAGCADLICNSLSALKNDWTPAIHVIQILSIVGALRALTLLTGPLMQSVNRPRAFMIMSWSLAGMNSISFCIAGFWLRGHADITVQAMGVAGLRALVFGLIYTPISMIIVMQICEMKAMELIRAVTPAMLASFIVCATGLGVTHLLDGADEWMHLPGKTWMVRLTLLMVGGGITSAIAFALMLIVEPEVKDFLIRRLMRKGPTTQTPVPASNVNMAEMEKPVAESAA